MNGDRRLPRSHVEFARALLVDGRKPIDVAVLVGVTDVPTLKRELGIDWPLKDEEEQANAGSDD